MSNAQCWYCLTACTAFIALNRTDVSSIKDANFLLFKEQTKLFLQKARFGNYISDKKLAKVTGKQVQQFHKVDNQIAFKFKTMLLTPEDAWFETHYHKIIFLDSTILYQNSQNKQFKELTKKK